MARKLNKVDRNKAIKMALISAVLAPILELIMKSGDIFALDYKTVINSVIIAVVTYLIKNFSENK